MEKKKINLNPKLIFGAVVVLLIIVIGLSGLYRINEGEEGLVLTFGRLTKSNGPGLYWHIPFVQQVRKDSLTRIYTMEYGFHTEQAGTTTQEATYSDVDEEAIMITGDQNIVRVEAVYQMVIKDLASYYYQVDDPMGTLQHLFETLLRRDVQSRTLDDALLNKQDIEAQLLPEFQRMADYYNLGVDIQTVRIQNIMVPDEVSSAYEDVNNAKNEKTRKLDEAEKYQNQVVPAARADAYRMVQEAEAYKASTVAQAQGDIALFQEILAKFQASPEITRKRLLIETLEAILSKADKLYIMNQDGGVLKLLNLDDGTTAAAEPAASATPTPAPAEGGN